MKLLADGLADALGHIVMKTPEGKSLPLSAVSGASFTSLEGAVASFRARSRTAFYAETTIEDRISSARVDYIRATNRCDSPIEKMLLPWLFFADYGPTFSSIPSLYLFDVDDIKPSSARRILIAPQMPIGRFRADFLVIASKNERERSLFAIECDGAKHHANNPRDLGRDLNLAGLGIVTIRSTGQEIYKEPSRAADRLAYRIREFFGE